MGINRASRYKRRATGGKRTVHKKKRKYELGRPAAGTRLVQSTGGEDAKRIHLIRTRGGNQKRRALRLESGNFSWGSEVCTQKVRIMDVVYNSSNNELVRTKTLVKNAIVLVDAGPFKVWYNKHYGTSISSSAKDTTDEEARIAGLTKYRADLLKTRRSTATLDAEIKEQLEGGRVLACISSRPGQSGRADGFLLEGEELQFYKRKLAALKRRK
jgi:small subunit ribosomal protein S8e